MLLEETIRNISEAFHVPLDRIAVFGFSQGAIMTVGLALQSTLDLEKYVACSGRTLPEFASPSRTVPSDHISRRAIFVAHVVQDP
jgi:predicted esterase